MKIEIQAPICPFCNDDHPSLRECNLKDLKKELLIIDIEDSESLTEKEKADLIKKVQWL